MPDHTPQQFVEKWERAELKERASAQSHFDDVCRLVGHPTPTEMDPSGEFFCFEAGGKTTSGGQGYADVWYKGHFAIEYKGKGKYETLDAAYQQLLKYREYLGNPPLLIVCDIEHWEIHTNFTGTEKRVHRFTNRDIATTTRIQRMLRWLFEDPQQFHPERTAEQVTAEAAGGFKDIASNMRAWEAAPERIAHFLTKLVFCLFAEDVGLLPAGLSGKGLFTEIVEQTRTKPREFVLYTQQLFQAMAQGGKVQFRDIRWFDGILFDDVVVEELSQEALNALERACRVDWSSVEPAIFGTLFERSLDPSKRAQLGAHYTSRSDILLIVEPVLMQPLRREWDTVQLEAAPVREKYDAALRDGTRATITRFANELLALRERILHKLRSVTVLDPACGSGNFLYVSLQLLKDMEKEVIHHPLWHDLPLAIPEVHPRQLYGVEINPIAHDLASIVVWIGYIQWQQNNGYLSFKEPILEPLTNIRQMDAILAFDEDGNPVEPEWPSVDVIVSNPPFLGDKKMRAELGDPYVDTLRNLYEDKIPGQSDLVCYWFEQARQMIEQGAVKRAGLLATNSIRGGANRRVLERIKETGDIFMAWSDRDWILEGAAVHVSMIGFDNGQEFNPILDGTEVKHINADLTGASNTVSAIRLRENSNLSFIGIAQHGPFSIDAEQAQQLLTVKNDSGLPNSDVVVRWANGLDITSRPRNMWIVDFGTERSEEEARNYRAPFQYVQEYVYPIRSQNRRDSRRKRWWLLGETMPKMRQALAVLDRYIGTPRVAKHRLFQWFDRSILPDNQIVVFARDDDYFFGVLHSRFHEKWALRMGTSLEDRPRYTPTTTFETFPFPWSPGQEPTDHPIYRAISAAAQQFHEEREVWLNPPGVSGKALDQRTLTNLYNALLVFRGDPPAEGKSHPKIVPAAGDFAPRLMDLHAALDRAVCDAYGWEYAVLDDEEEILRRLLALNLERAG
ncbi:MAG: class I SAM-dependent DNA methyltransferase [Chloroflexi bacterium]|nr:class I SAM-dependent DNA methyltransferase [Chloroflexota bacterium]